MKDLRLGSKIRADFFSEVLDRKQTESQSTERQSGER